MNLLFICDEYPPGPHGGIGTAVQLLARALVAKGHTIIVAGCYDWGYSGLDYEVDKGVQVYRFRRWGSGRWAQQRKALPVRIAYRLFRKTGLFQWAIGKSLPAYRQFLQELIRKHHIQLAEITDFQDYVQHLQHPAFFPELPVPYIVKLHGNVTAYLNADVPTRSAIRETEKELLRRAQGIVAVSRFIQAQTARIFNLPLSGKVIPNGLDLSPFSKQLSFKDPHKVVFSGTLVPLKGIYQLVKAWNEVTEVVPEARLEVYGKGALNHLLPLLTEKSRASLSFHGHVSRETLLQNLGEAAIGVFPSYTESFGLGAAEAMASGCAVIYTQRAAGPELITDGVDGLLVDPDDVAALAQKLITLLKNPELRQTLAQNALRSVGRFDIRSITDLHLDYYNQLICESNP